MTADVDSNWPGPPEREERPAPPPPEQQLFTQTGAAGSGLFRATWPFGKFRASVNHVGIGLFFEDSPGTLREDVEAIEYRAGAFGSKVWIVERNGFRSKWFLTTDLNTLLQNLTRLGWPVRERRR